MRRGWCSSDDDESLPESVGSEMVIEPSWKIPESWEKNPRLIPPTMMEPDRYLSIAMVIHPDLAERVLSISERDSVFVDNVIETMRDLHPKNVFIRLIESLDIRSRDKMRYLDALTGKWFTDSHELAQAKNINRELRYHFCQSPSYPETNLPIEVDNINGTEYTSFISLSDMAEVEPDREYSVPEAIRYYIENGIDPPRSIYYDIVDTMTSGKTESLQHERREEIVKCYEAWITEFYILPIKIHQDVVRKKEVMKRAITFYEQI
jgi:hypothetical protein